MSSRRRVAGLIGVCVVSVLAPRAARAEGFAIGVEGGFYQMTNASNSAKAVFDGSSGGATFGGLARVDLGRSFFAGVGGRVFRKDGQRVFVADKDSPSFPLGHPLKVRILPVYALLGYRFSHDAALTPYAGLGVGLTSYHEESNVAGDVTNVSTSKVSGHLVAGLEYGRSHLRFAVEGMYMTAPNTIGLEGVSNIYDEDDVGGLSVVGRVVFVP
jgi:opacity protein-like surface antigen